jgi:hypothetical protein
MFLVLAICFAAFPWEFIDPAVLEAASQVACADDHPVDDHFDHDHGDHSGTEDPCGDNCGCLCCPGHGQFPGTAIALPGAPLRAIAPAPMPDRDDRRGRTALNDIFRPPRSV